MFTFFYPLMWLAVPLLGIPLWLHLQRRNDPQTVRFSAMQFLEDEPLARRRPLLPRDLPLLLLRLLLILLVIAAFAWPYVLTDDEVLIRESRVYILDNTLSNQAGGRIEALRESLADAVASADLETQVAVVELTSEPRVLVHFGDAPELAARQIGDLQPGSSRGSYAAAFRLAKTLLDQALGENRRIVVMSDSQQNQWEDDAGIPPFLEQTEVELPHPETDSLPNASVRQPMVQRMPAGPQSIVHCSVRVWRLGQTGTPRLTVLVNGRELVSDTIEMSTNNEQTLLIELPDLQDTWLHGEIRVEAEGDALEADNRAFFSLPPIKVGRVALLAESIYLRTALSQQVIAGRWSTELLTPERINGHQQADVLVVESPFLAERSVRDLVKNYLSAGRGVALLVGGGPALSGPLRDLGIQLLSEEQLEAAPLRYIFLEHPIFQPFRSADAGNLADITVGRYRRLQADGATPLAFSATGDPVLLDITVGHGRLLAVGFRLDRTETNWPLHPTFLPFLDRCLKHLQRPEEQRVTDYLPGETCVWNLPVDDSTLSTTGGFLQLQRFGQSSPPLRVPLREGQVRFAMPDLPGNYDLRLDGEDQLQAVLSVNPPPEESLLTFQEGSKTLEGWRREPSDDDSSEPALTLADLTSQQILRQHIWWWLLAAGALLLVTETLWITRKLPPSLAEEA